MTRTTLRRITRVAGILLFVSMMAGGFGELYLPTMVTEAGDAAATAERIRSMDTLFRLGFAAYLVEGLCNVILILIFYVLSRPIQKDLALLAAFFGLVGVGVFAVAELFYLAPLLLVGGDAYLSAFAEGERSALALLSLKFYGFASGVLMAFGGAGSMIYGFLFFLSGYLPRALAALLALGGAAFVARNFLLVLAPLYAFDWLFLPMLIAMLGLGIWMVVRGVDVEAWEARAGAAEGGHKPAQSDLSG